MKLESFLGEELLKLVAAEAYCIVVGIVVIISGTCGSQDQPSRQFSRATEDSKFCNCFSRAMLLLMKARADVSGLSLCLAADAAAASLKGLCEPELDCFSMRNLQTRALD